MVVYADTFITKAEQEKASASGEDARRVGFLKRFTVFHVEQCEGLPADPDAAQLPGRTEVLSHVDGAIAADSVFRRGATVSVNGVAVAEARAVDGEGRSLPDWQGCVRLGPGEVFLLGDGPASYDGRYFGVTLASEVVGPVRQLLNRSPLPSNRKN